MPTAATRTTSSTTPAMRRAAVCGGCRRWGRSGWSSGSPSTRNPTIRRSCCCSRSGDRSSSDATFRIRGGGMRTGHRFSSRRVGRVLAAVGAACLLFAGVARAEMRIAVVDLQRALNECDAGKKAKESVKGKFEKAQNELKKEREDLDKARDEFEKRAVLLKEDERRNRERELENRTLDFKRKYED